jgi:hypothetical protein
MKKTTVKSFAGLVLALFVCVQAKSQDDNEQVLRVVTSAVPFLKISPDARAGGMGDLALATMPDASSSYYNLGKVPFNI